MRIGRSAVPIGVVVGGHRRVDARVTSLAFALENVHYPENGEIAKKANDEDDQVSDY